VAEKRKAGRKPKPGGVGPVVTLRLDPVSGAIVDELAARYGLNRSSVLRQAVRRWGMTEQPPLKRAG
jgi:ribbon-helix-helix CopG family protein